jgi:hypothetical protein
VAQVSLDRPGTAGDHSRAVTLFFDPSWGYHTFGIGRRPGAVEFTVDGMVIHRFAAAAVGPLPAGKARLVLANWTGDPARAGQPPQKATYLLVDWLSWTPVHFTADRRDVPVGAGGRTTMRLDAGPAAAGTTYLVALSTRATSAGTPLAGGATLPLDPDPVGLALTLLAMQPGPPFTGFFGTLSAGGGASPDFMLPAGLPPALAGTTFHFACFAPFAPAPFVAGPLSVTIR